MGVRATSGYQETKTFLSKENEINTFLADAYRGLLAHNLSFELKTEQELKIHKVINKVFKGINSVKIS